jgi:DNA-binding transcriptional regulator YiaG
MAILEKKDGYYWGKSGPYGSSQIARKVGALAFIRGEEALNKIAQDEHCLDDIKEDELREAWASLVAKQARRKIKQEDAEILAAVLTAELINRNQAGLLAEEDNTNIQPQGKDTVKSEITLGEKSPSCVSCTDSHWSTVSGYLNEAVRMIRQGLKMDSDEILDRLQLVKEELNVWERFDASPDKLEKTDDETKIAIRDMVRKSAELRHMMFDRNLASGRGTLSDLEGVASFARKATLEFQKAIPVGTQPQKVQVTRDGKTFMQTVHVKPEEPASTTHTAVPQAQPLRVSTHAWQREIERTGFGVIKESIANLSKKQLPPKDWYHHISQDGFVVGIGNVIKTVLAPEMKPWGVMV